MGTGQRWHVLEEMGGTTPWQADKIGWSCCIWPKKKSTKNTKQTMKK